MKHFLRLTLVESVLLLWVIVSFFGASALGQAGYQIYFYENFDSYSLGDFFAQPNSTWKPAYFLGTTAVTPQIMDHAVNGRYLKLALNNQPSDNAVSSLETKTLQNAFNRGFFNSAWHWNPQTGHNERNRWAVISELFLTDAAVVDIDHTLTAMRAVETGYGTSRFGVYLRPGTYYPAPGEGVLQFSNPASHYPDYETVGFAFPLSEQLRTDGSVRYALTFEEWEQADGFWVLRHWKGTVYKVNTSTLPWVYTPLGSLEAAEAPDGRVYDGNIWVEVPPINGSELLFGLVKRTLDVDLQLFYAAYYSY